MSGAPAGRPHLLHGSDEALVSQAAAEVVRTLVGDGERTLMVDDLLIDDDVNVHRLIATAGTPPFLSDRRVVVARGVERLGSDDLAVLRSYLAEPLPTTDLVLIHQGKAPKRLVDAVTSVGGVVASTDVGASRRDRSTFVEAHVGSSGLHLSGAARSLLVDQLGEDVNRLSGLLDTLSSTFGPGARLDVEDVTPYLGDQGGVPPWDLTDAIDRGDRPVALEALARMVQAGGRHPLQVMAVLHAHYARLLRLDGSGARDEATAGAILGVKGFAARKALERTAAMGPDAVHEAIQLLARADLDLRGRRELPESAVLEVLVARLCRLSRTRTPSARSRRR